MSIERLRHWSVANWFLLAAPLLALVGWSIARSTSWQSEDAAGLETALLIDACLTIPLLYMLCYWRRLPKAQLFVRSLALACLGLLLLSYVVPVEGQKLLPAFGWARTLGVGVLVLIELRLLVQVLRLVFRAGASADEVTRQTGAPPLVAKLMLLEARFWKFVWRLLRRR